MDTTKFTCRCGQEDWYHESRANTNEGPDAEGRIHRIYAPCDKLVPKPGKPHIARQSGEWRVIVNSKQLPPWSLSAIALSHAEILEKAWKDLNFFVDDRPPQAIVFTERQDPTRWD
jgi:hypothetical protein